MNKKTRKNFANGDYYRISISDLEARRAEHQKELAVVEWKLENETLHARKRRRLELRAEQLAALINRIDKVLEHRNNLAGRAREIQARFVSRPLRATG